MLFIYRIINNLSPELGAGSLKEITTKYSLRSKSTCKTSRFGSNSVIFTGSFLWNGLPNSCKEIKTETD